MDGFWKTLGSRGWMRGRASLGRKYLRESSSNETGSAGKGKDGGADWTEHVAMVGGRQSLLVAAWYRGVSLRMQTMGQMMVQYQRRSKAGGNYTEDDYGMNGRLNYLLQVRPNPLMTASQMMEQIEFHKIFYGNAYVYLEKDEGGMLQAMWLCSSGHYNMGGDSYWLTYQTPRGLMSVEAPREDVLHFKNVFLYDDMVEGMPVIRYAMKSLQIAGTADQQALHDMAKGGRYKLLVREDAPQALAYGASAAGRADQQELRQLTEELGEDWMSKDAVFANNIADVKIISQTAADLKLLETRGYQVTEIARLLGVPKPMMMDDSNSSYKTPEAATQEFLLRTISPLIREMEDEYNSKLLGAEDFGKRRIHICEKALRRLDPTAQANLFKTYLETGAYTVNEIRGEMDMPSVEDGDKNYISTNLAELGSEKLSGESKSDGGKDSRIEQETVTTSPWMGAAVIQRHTGREYGMEADENGTRTEGAVIQQHTGREYGMEADENGTRTEGAVIQRHTGREKTGEKREGGEG